MDVRAIVFDLDGTLLDTLADIGNAANRALADEGHPAHPRDAYREFVGEGVRMLFERALPPGFRTAEAIDRCVAGFHQHYDAGWNQETRLYDGIASLLDTAVASGLRLAVLSNKPDAFTRLCVEHYLASWPFDPVMGQREGLPRKPDPAGALAIAATLNLPPECILYVGDTNTDMQTARRAGMIAVGVAWGFRPVAELIESGAQRIADDPLSVLTGIVSDPSTILPS